MRIWLTRLRRLIQQGLIARTGAISSTKPEIGQPKR